MSVRCWGLTCMLSSAGVGCGDPRPAPSRPRGAEWARDRPRPDKASLFGDPALLPTREGERARTELAYAGEIESAIRLLQGAVDVRVDVELTPRLEAPTAAVVARFAAETALNERRLDIDRILHAVLPDGGAARTEIVLSVVEPERPESGPSKAPLAIACLGLGFCVGVAFERLRKLGRRR